LRAAVGVAAVKLNEREPSQHASAQCHPKFRARAWGAFAKKEGRASRDQRDGPSRLLRQVFQGFFSRI
jgi:hypothetical protein